MKIKAHKSGTVSLKSIKTPSNKEEFRNNLRKYFVTTPKGHLWVQPVPQNSVDISTLNSMSDFYKTCPYGVFVVPMVEFSMEQVERYMKKNGLISSARGFFDDESNYRLYTNPKKFLDNAKTFRWHSMDNPILRDFYIQVLGDYSGYKTGIEELKDWGLRMTAGEIYSIHCSVPHRARQ